VDGAPWPKPRSTGGLNRPPKVGPKGPRRGTLGHPSGLILPRGGARPAPFGETTPRHPSRAVHRQPRWFFNGPVPRPFLPSNEVPWPKRFVKLGAPVSDGGGGGSPGAEAPRRVPSLLQCPPAPARQRGNVPGIRQGRLAGKGILHPFRRLPSPAPFFLADGTAKRLFRLACGAKIPMGRRTFRPRKAPARIRFPFPPAHSPPVVPGASMARPRGGPGDSWTFLVSFTARCACRPASLAMGRGRSIPGPWGPPRPSSGRPLPVWIGPAAGL